MKSSALSIFLFSLTFSFLASAASIRGKCGDHWFRIDFTADTETSNGVMRLSGDSGTNGDLLVSLKSNEKGVIHLTSQNPNAYLVLHPQGEDQNTYFGIYSADGSKKSEQDTGICTVEFN